MAKRTKGLTSAIEKLGKVKKRTEIGKSRQSRPKSKNKRKSWKKYRGQGK